MTQAEAFPIPERPLDRLLARLPGACAGRHLTISEMLDDPAIQALDPGLDEGQNRRERGRLLGDVMWMLVDRRQAVRSVSRFTRFTVGRPGESYPAMVQRHAHHLITHHPGDYLPDGFRSHFCQLTDVDYRRDGRAADLALMDGRVCQAWYPDGLPDLSRPLRGDALTRLQGYAADLFRRATEYAASIDRGPAWLHREVEAGRLPCQADTPEHPLAVPSEPRALLDAPRALTRFLWMPFQAGDGPQPVYLLSSTPDPVSGQVRRAVGLSEMSLAQVRGAYFLELGHPAARCCPEVGWWALVAGDQPSRFHRREAPVPPIPTVPTGHIPGGEAHYSPLQPVGWLVTDTTGHPWSGMVAWADERGPRAWEGAGQENLASIIARGRSWNHRSGTLCTAGGLPAGSLSPAEAARALTPLLPYNLHEWLHAL